MFLFSSTQFHKKLFDRISSQVMSPSRAPPGDAINRCRDAVDSIQAATSHKYSRDRAELVHLLGSPHIQVSDDVRDYATNKLLCSVLGFRSFVEPGKTKTKNQTGGKSLAEILSSHTHGRREIAVNQTINNPEAALNEDKNAGKK